MQVRASPGRDEKGFTIIELVVVMFIMGVMAVAVIPDLRAARASYELRSAARQMQGDLREWIQSARVYRSPGLDTAEAYQGYYNVLFDSENNKYILRNSHPAEGVSDKREVFLPDSVDLVGTNFKGELLGVNVYSDAKIGVLEVYRNGGVRDGGGGRVRLQSKVTGEDLYIVVTSLTGQVRISPVDPGVE